MSQDEIDYFTIPLAEQKVFEMKGYSYFYMPGHPLAVQNGCVAIRRHVMSVHLGRWLTPDEAVVAVNNDRTEVRPEFLRVIPKSERLNWNREVNKVALVCEFCGAEFWVYPANVPKRRHCSNACDQKSKRRFDVTKEELSKLVWEMPLVHIADKYNVSDKAIAKRCKLWGIATPGRGYWRKVETGKIDSVTGEFVEEDESY